MKVIDFLFGWLTKPTVLHTPLDEIMCIIEIFVLLPIGIAVIWQIIENIKEWKERKNKKC